MREVERAVPCGRARALQPHLGLVVGEVSAHRQRRRREDPCTRAVGELLAHDIGDGQRRRVQLQRSLEHFDPAHSVALRGLPPVLDARAQLLRAAIAIVQPLAAVGLELQQARQRTELLGDFVQRLPERLALVQHLRGLTRRLFAHREAQIARSAIHSDRRFRQRGEVLGAGRRLDPRVPRQLDQLSGGNALSEEQAGSLGKLMRLVENHRVARREKLGDSLVAQHHVGEEQVMIDDDHIRGQRLFARLHHEAILVARAFAAQAVVPRGGDQRPDRRRPPALRSARSDPRSWTCARSVPRPADGRRPRG